MKTCWSLQVTMRASMIPAMEICQFLRDFSLDGVSAVFGRGVVGVSLPRQAVHDTEDVLG